jgi:hypothetical protein
VLQDEFDLQILTYWIEKAESEPDFQGSEDQTRLYELRTQITKRWNVEFLGPSKWGPFQGVYKDVLEVKEKCPKESSEYSNIDVYKRALNMSQGYWKQKGALRVVGVPAKLNERHPKKKTPEIEGSNGQGSGGTGKRKNEGGSSAAAKKQDRAEKRDVVESDVVVIQDSDDEDKQKKELAKKNASIESLLMRLYEMCVYD